MTDRPAVSPELGLTEHEVAERVAAGLVNHVPEAPSRTIGQIFRSNIVTKFNMLMGALLAVVLVFGSPKDALFGGIIVANAAIGIVQEIRAKRTLDRLSVLSEPHASLVRGGEVAESPVDQMVLDDIVEMSIGNQVCADGHVVMASSLEVDESLLTGESDPVMKNVGDEVMSGSFVVSGSGRMQVTKVGAEAYAAQLAEQARRFTLANSELRNGIDKIISLVSFALIPVGIALFLTQYHNEPNFNAAMVKSAGGLVAMVPEGLVLLVSVAFAAGVVRLASKRTLVQELPAIETLARVDVVCLDKTGTITEGVMEVVGVSEVNGASAEEVGFALAAIAATDPHPNPTQQAVQAHFSSAPQGWNCNATVPFSSARKWSGASFDEQGSWILGAPEMVLVGGIDAAIASSIDQFARRGQRVLVLARHDEELTEALPAGTTAQALVCIEDRLRDDAEATLQYFADQGVTLKVISGDNPVTVGSVAARAGLPHADQLRDARDLPEDQEELADILESTSVFGRVSPQQKRQMVTALQSRGHIVAMTGDGVNDVLALKDADVGIAMAAGSEASRAVAQLVLLDSNFSGLPFVVLEGRTVINNLQRVAVLFLTKTVWALWMALITSVFSMPYPFLPRHITIVSTGIIGIPSFFLALAPNTERIRGRFVDRVLRYSIPAGTIIACCVMVVYALSRNRHLEPIQQQTSAALVLLVLSLVVLTTSARPWAVWKLAMVSIVGAVVSLSVLLPRGREFFEFSLPSFTMLVVIAIVCGVGTAALFGARLFVDRTIHRSGRVVDHV